MRKSLLVTVLALAALAAFMAADARLTATTIAGGPAGPALTVLDGITYENVTLFPVVNAVRNETGGFLTLDEGLTSGDVIVREMGDTLLRRTRDGRKFVTLDGGATWTALK